jgi:hypothetical protein
MPLSSTITKLSGPSLSTSLFKKCKYEDYPAKKKPEIVFIFSNVNIS